MITVANRIYVKLVRVWFNFPETHAEEYSKVVP